MHLQYHLRLQTFCLHASVNANHRYLYDVGSTTLNGRVDGVSLCISTNYRVVRVDVWKRTTTLEDSLRVTSLASHLDAFVHVGFHARICREVFVDELLGFSPRNAHPLSKSEGTYAVDDAEIGRLGFASLVRSDLLQRLLKDFSSSCSMNVVALQEGFYKVLVLTEMRHNPQLDLAVVGTEKELSGIRNEGFSHFLALRVSNRNVLQVRI